MPVEKSLAARHAVQLALVRASGIRNPTAQDEQYRSIKKFVFEATARSASPRVVPPNFLHSTSQT